MSRDNVVELQSPRRIVPTKEDLAEVGRALDELRRRHEAGEIGSMCTVYLDPKRDHVKTDFVKMPGSTWVELVGMAYHLAQVIRDKYRS